MNIGILGLSHSEWTWAPPRKAGFLKRGLFSQGTRGPEDQGTACLVSLLVRSFTDSPSVAHLGTPLVLEHDPQTRSASSHGKMVILGPTLGCRARTRGPSSQVLSATLRSAAV